MNQEASNLKAKIRRLEEDNLKKEKEIDGLLNPQKVSVLSMNSLLMISERSGLIVFFC